VKAVYRLTEDGRATLDAADGEVKAFIALIDEGWNVESLIARTKAGRASAVLALAELVREEAVAEVPEEELMPLAAQLIAQKRFEQAIGVYRRFLGLSREDALRKEAINGVKACEEAMAAIREAEEREESVAPLRQSAEPAPPSRRRIVWAAVALLVLAAAGGVAAHYTLSVRDRLRRDAAEADIKAFAAAKAASAEKLAAGDFAGAKAPLNKYLGVYPAGSGSAKALAEIERISAAYEELVKKKIDAADALYNDGKTLDGVLGAITAYKEIIANHPDSGRISGVRERLKAAEAKCEEFRRSLTN
jgi:hypothetical protein